MTLQGPKANNADIRLIALDLDGTLLDSNKQIDPSTISAINHLVKQGMYIVIASARPPRSVRHIYRMLGLNTVQINYNGALIWDEQQNRAIYHDPLPANIAQNIITAARNFYTDVIIQCEILDKQYTDRIDDRFTTETGKLFPPDVVSDLTNFWNKDITKLMLLANDAMITKLRVEVENIAKQSAKIVQSDPDLLQISHPNTGKGIGLQRVAEMYHINTRHILAIGDAENDIDMLQRVGYPVAIGNAPENVKKYAQWIAPTNDQRGVMKTLQFFNLL